MASIAKCPKCEAAVAMPAEADRETEVRCPYCEALYRLDEVAGDAVPLPLEFVPVAAGEGTAVAETPAEALAAEIDAATQEAGVEPALPEALEAEPATDVGEPTDAPVDAAAAAELPLEEGQPPEAQVEVPTHSPTEQGVEEMEPGIDEPSFAPAEEESVAEEEGGEGELQPEPAEPAEAAEPSESEQAVPAALKSEFVAGIARLWNLTGAAPAAVAAEAPWLGASSGVEEAPQFDFGGPAAVAEEHGAFAIRTEEEVGEERAAVPVGRPVPRRKRKKKSGLREMIEIVLGGFLGLAIGYFLLNLISKNPQFDFLKIPLPWVEHTYKHAPEWWPWEVETQEGQEKVDEGQQPAEGSPPPDERKPSKPEQQRQEKAENQPKEDDWKIDLRSVPAAEEGLGPAAPDTGGGPP